MRWSRSKPEVPSSADRLRAIARRSGRAAGSSGQQDDSRWAPEHRIEGGWVPDWAAPEDRRTLGAVPDSGEWSAPPARPVRGSGAHRVDDPGEAAWPEPPRLPATDDDGRVEPAPASSRRRRGRHAPRDAEDPEFSEGTDWADWEALSESAEEDWVPAHTPGGDGPAWVERWVPASLRTSRRGLTGRSATVLVVVAVVAVSAAGWSWWTSRPQATPVSSVSIDEPNAADVSRSPVSEAVSITPSDTADPVPTDIWVSVTGRVNAPGLYRLTADARVADALEAAGGLIDPADLTGINLAQPVSDGMSVVVRAEGTGVTAASGAAVPGAAPAGPSGTVDLNTADQAMLETLPGVGPVMAAAIVTWRTENGPFTSVEQLREVSGIGPARFAQLAPLVRV